MSVQIDKVKITAKQVINQPAQSFWIVVGWVQPRPGILRSLSSTDRYQSKDEAVEDMKRQVRELLMNEGVYTSDEDIAWEIQEG